MDEVMHTVFIPGNVEVERTYAIPARPAAVEPKPEMPAVVVTEAYLTASEAELPALHAETIGFVAESLGLPVAEVVQSVQRYIPAGLGEPGVREFALPTRSPMPNTEAETLAVFAEIAEEQEAWRVRAKLSAPQAAAVEDFFRGVQSPALHAQTIQAIQEELDKPMSVPVYQGDKQVGTMEYTLSERLTLRRKPKIKKIFGQWVCCVRPGETSRWAAKQATAFCNKLNEGSLADLIERGWIDPAPLDYFSRS